LCATYFALFIQRCGKLVMKITVFMKTARDWCIACSTPGK
jgi:hypothetical protein